MMSDSEMERWRNQWSSAAGLTEAAPNPRDIIVAVRRHQLRSQVGLAANLAFGVLLIAGSFIVARQIHSREIVLWAIVVWMATLVASFLALEGWRKTRIADTETVADFAALHRRKAVADQWKARTGSILLAVLFCISGAWLTIDLVAGRISTERFGLASGLMLAISATFAGVFAYMLRRSKSILGSIPED